MALPSSPVAIFFTSDSGSSFFSFNTRLRSRNSLQIISLTNRSKFTQPWLGKLLSCRQNETVVTKCRFSFKLLMPIVLHVHEPEPVLHHLRLIGMEWAFIPLPFKILKNWWPLSLSSNWSVYWTISLVCAHLSSSITTAPHPPQATPLSEFKQFALWLAYLAFSMLALTLDSSNDGFWSTDLRLSSSA